MAIAPSYMRRKPLSSMLDFAEERAREAASIGEVITKLAQPTLSSMGAAPEPAVQRGPAPVPQKLGTMTGPAMAPTPVEFNAASKARLAQVDPRLAELMTRVEAQHPNAFQITEGMRDAERQAQMVAEGKSQTQNSKHLVGNAVDIALMGPDGQPNWNFEDYKPIAETAKSVAAELGIPDFVWGGDWKSLRDGVHFQVGGPAADGLTVSTKGGPAGAPQNVEDILGSLYPVTSPEDEKRMRRKDFLAAAGQGLSALSQGGTVDFTNIRQAAEARRQQGVQDMRERERARAAASLVYSQTGDSDMAGAIASGAISYGDVVSERERQRIERDADTARVKQEQANGRLAGLVEMMLPDMGLPEAAKTKILESVAAGDDPNTIFTMSEQAKLADAARKADEAAVEAAENRDAAIADFSASGSPVEAYAARIMSLQPDLAVDAALKLATDQLGKPDEKVYQFQAEIDARVANLGEDLPTATRAVLDKATQQGVNLTFGPDGKVAGVSVGGTAAPGVAAPGTVIDIAKPSAGTVQGVSPEGVVTETPIAGAVAPQQALTDLAASQQGMALEAAAGAQAAALAPVELETKRTALAADQQALTTAVASAPDEAAKLDAEARLADVNAKIAQADYDAIVANQDIDAATKATALAAAQLNVENAQLDVDKKKREIEDAETGDKAASAKRGIRSAATTDASTRQVSRLLGMAKDWQPGIAGGVSRLVAGYFPGSEIYNANTLVESLDANSIISTIQLMKESSPSGATGFGATTMPELAAMENQIGKLDPLADPEIFMENLRGFNNFVLDSAYGTQAEVLANDALTDTEKEFYGQRFDLKTGKVLDLGLEALDDGVITLWDKEETSPALDVQPSDLTPEELEIFNSINGG